MLLYNVLLFDLFSIEGKLIEQQSHLINRKATNLFQIEEIENLEILINILAHGSKEANKIFQLDSAPLSSTKVVNPLENVLQQWFLQFSTLSSSAALVASYPIPGRLQLFQTRVVLLSSYLPENFSSSPNICQVTLQRFLLKSPSQILKKETEQRGCTSGPPEWDWLNIESPILSGKS